MIILRKHNQWRLFSLISLGLLFFVFHTTLQAQPTPPAKELAEQLGWVEKPGTRCGGYYLESPFLSKEDLKEAEKLHITSDQYTIVQHGTSVLEGKVTLNYGTRQIIANKAYLYRDPISGKLTGVDLAEALHLREPNTLILAEKGHVDLKTKANSLFGIVYRTTIYGNLMNAVNYNQVLKQKSAVPLQALDKPRPIKQLSAWGEAKSYSQTESKIYHFKEVSYSTCPPTHSFWQVKASKLDLNKETGRGTANNARLLIKGLPVFYTPYMNFPIDSRRKTGFLWPTIGSINRNNSYSGYYLGLPFYWNLAPNYDTTLTPTYYTERGFQLADLFRYLTPSSKGRIQASIFPDDQYFPTFKEKLDQRYQGSTDPFKQAELYRLMNTHNTRYSLGWTHETQFNDHWSASVDYSQVSDDYFLEDFTKNLTENAQNNLLQQGELHYAGEHWDFLGRIQGYQTLHPADVDSIFYNQYRRFPQLLLGGDYPNQWGGLHYFIGTEATRFDIKNTPGDTNQYPIGDRLHLQPGVEWPLNWPAFYLIPRAQLALSEYELGHVTATMPKHQTRGLPIFDFSSGLYLDRNFQLFRQDYTQTLEPQLYYVYIPYRNQTQIPIFDTTVNTLIYDQLFVYNRFSGIDRINDANRISLGITTRIIDQKSGVETLRAAVGEIIYFKNRAVTLCQNPQLCTDYPANNDNKRHLSPISGSLSYNMAAHWGATADVIWDPQTKQLNNQTITLHYKQDSERVINLGFSYVRNGDLLGGIIANSNATVVGTGNENILKLTDLSFSWPVAENWGLVGRWSEDWNTLHFQNLFYGLQYDSCCWAAQFVAGRTFTGVQETRPQYSNQFYFQIILKGLGTFNPKGDPTAILRNNISGYDSRFGQDI
ncbi:MAG TPA: LPS-assembly protein LptD [Gammaproteobacteria bacterium]|nr:LPS-assembly protein LptD [Gammaproteobacteria bacterium]